MTTKMETRIESGAQHYQWPWALTTIFILCSLPLISTEETYTEFAPHVAATCKAGTMNIKVNFNSPYVGIVHARGYRNSSCVAYGNGTTSVGLSLNLLASQSQNDYCGTLVSNVNNERTEERSIQLAVRVHKTLELADDKFYVITCGKTSFTRDDNSQVILKFFEDNRRVRETVYGRPYTIRAEITHPNISNHIHVKNCFAFGKKNTSFHLIDNRGCPIDSKIMTKFVQEENKSSAFAVLQTMFKFPEGSEVHLQCDIVQCTNNCPDQNICSNSSLDTKSRSITEIEEPIILAATTVFVIDPADAAVTAPICDDSGIHPSWLLWLTIALGILFLIMLLMNIFLCTAMSCSCARTEIIEKEPSIIEEYDPYRSWHGSQYGSRYSLHARDGHNKGYTSGGSTIHSNRSLPIESDHYAIVHSRPGSRHSGINGYRRRGPPSNL